MSISTSQAILYGFIPFGDLILRVNELQGSSDQIWTVAFPIFQLPVLGLIPTMMMKFGVIKEGNLKVSPLDGFIILTLFIRFVKSFLIEKLDEPWSKLFDYGLTLFGIILPIVIRLYSPLCTLCKGDLSQGVHVMLKVFTSATVIMAISELLVFILNNLSV